MSQSAVLNTSYPNTDIFTGAREGFLLAISFVALTSLVIALLGLLHTQGALNAGLLGSIPIEGTYTLLGVGSGLWALDGVALFILLRIDRNRAISPIIQPDFEEGDTLVPVTMGKAEVQIPQEVLMQHSDKFRTMFSGGFKENSIEKIDFPVLEGIDDRVSETFLCYLTTNNKKVIHAGNVISLLKLATKHEMDHLQFECALCLKENLDLATLEKFLLCAIELQAYDAIWACLMFASNHNRDSDLLKIIDHLTPGAKQILQWGIACTEARITIDFSGRYGSRCLMFKNYDSFSQEALTLLQEIEKEIGITGLTIKDFEAYKISEILKALTFIKELYELDMVSDNQIVEPLPEHWLLSLQGLDLCGIGLATLNAPELLELTCSFSTTLADVHLPKARIVSLQNCHQLAKITIPRDCELTGPHHLRNRHSISGGQWIIFF